MSAGYHPRLRLWDQEFEASLGYTVGSKAAWTKYETWIEREREREKEEEKKREDKGRVC
jgi:hypothetical protein